MVLAKCGWTRLPLRNRVSPLRVLRLDIPISSPTYVIYTKICFVESVRASSCKGRSPPQDIKNFPSFSQSHHVERSLHGPYCQRQNLLVKASREATCYLFTALKGCRQTHQIDRGCDNSYPEVGEESPFLGHRRVRQLAAQCPPKYGTWGAHTRSGSWMMHGPKEQDT